MDKLKFQMRQGTQMLKQKMGKSEKTQDSEFDEIYANFTGVEKATLSTLKHLNQLIENFHAMTTTLQFISEDFRDASYQSAIINDASSKMAQMAEHAERTAVIPFQKDITAECVNPINDYVVLFEPIHKLISERKKLLLEYDYRRDKVKDLTEKQGKDPLALPRAKEKMAKAKEDFETVNTQAKEQMQSVLSKHTEVYEPMLERLAKHLTAYYSNLVSACSGTNFASSMAGAGSGIRSPSVVKAGVSGSSGGGGGNADKILPNRFSAMNLKPTPDAGALRAELDCEWFYLDKLNHQMGPVPFETLLNLYKRGEINDNTHVFGGEMEQWAVIGNCPRLKLGLTSL